jgi:hypothetical protein
MNAAVLLAAEMMQADHIRFLVGQSVNPYYQNPLLPKNVSIRTNLVGMIGVHPESWTVGCERIW